MKIELEKLQQRKQKLEELRAKLKNDFFGIDEPIDKIVNSIKTWWLMPEIITRPVIVSLWSMTGTGKTDLVRKIGEHLGLFDKLLEVQMDSPPQGKKSICEVLRESSLGEGEAGIIFLDEFQRFRTINNDGSEVKSDVFQDVWMLLSDGKFSNDLTILHRMQDYLCEVKYNEDYENYSKSKKNDGKDTNKESFSATREFHLESWTARRVKSMLRSSIDVEDFMRMNKDEVVKLISDYIKNNQNKPIDYSKCLIFVAGNLDEAFTMAESTEDCDTDADVFHERTKKISVIEIKKSLGNRFKPEQIARLGNNHVIYASLNKDSYYKIIKRSCFVYTEEAAKVSGVNFVVDESVYKNIYENSVYPTQGTRPVFSSIHKMFGSPMSDGVLWALEKGITSVRIGINPQSSCLTFTDGIVSHQIKIDFDIRDKKKSYSSDYNALVAGHEAGHALIHALLFKLPPKQCAINVASFTGGYIISNETVSNKKELLDSICVALGGLAAEEILFGNDLRSSGVASDISHATSKAAKYVRTLGMDGFVSRVFKNQMHDFNEDVDATNPVIENIMVEAKNRAISLLTQNRSTLVEIARELMVAKKLSADEFFEKFKNKIPGLDNKEEQDTMGNYYELLFK